MDALDAMILRQLGMEPFAGRENRPLGLRATDVANSLGRSVRLVQDRITRMERDGVIAGYAMIPNPRHFGMDLTTIHIPTASVAEPAVLAKLADVDGFVFVVAYLGEGICCTMNHRSADELGRRLNVVQGLVGSDQPSRPMYQHALPRVEREMSPLDWRIVAAFVADAKRPASEVADELGVTVKTIRARLARMREEGSIDEIAILDFMKMQGIMPFEIAVWLDDGAAYETTLPKLLAPLAENYLLHFRAPPDSYCDILLRVFTTTPAEANQLVRRAEAVRGVARAEALMAAGAHDDHRWLQEAIGTRLQAAVA